MGKNLFYCIPAYSFPVNHTQAQHSGFDNPRSVSACVPEAFALSTSLFTFSRLRLFFFYTVFRNFVRVRKKYESTTDTQKLKILALMEFFFFFFFFCTQVAT